MNWIAHRINSIEELKNTPIEYGIEVDLRDYGDRLILQHDPFSDGEDFDEFLKFYKHGTIILNIKSERIENRVLEILKHYRILNYFFLDCSFPMIYLLSQLGERNIALRYSEYEGIDTIISMKGKVKWVWVDCFTKLPIDKNNYDKLKNSGFNLCLVSPELQGRVTDIEIYKNQLNEQGIVFDAICTKLHNMELWKS
ncbi:hypothetical protein [Paenibacillus sp. FSL H7-0331]|uniref:hypothetical protein n=1 Tax=Paenibacillus sp. FSL H7-0331 TaxID=1920421 RepID=UPI00096D9DCF|nr:hypothetical protein [Paenibacillus sp. FSL H7-0331]OMF08579.1 hypothetical protein BK127_28325 [Paenibacillus sp. FSL H7-0331]